MMYLQHLVHVFPARREIAQTKARHRVCLRNSVYRDDIVRKLRGAYVLRSIVYEILIDLIRDDGYMMVAREVSKCFYVRLAFHATRRICRRIHDEYFCFCRDSFLQCFYGHRKVFGQWNANRFALCQLRQCRVGDKTGVRHQHLVSFLYY